MPGRAENLRVDDPASDIAAPVRNVTSREAIDPGRAFGRVELGGVLQVPDAALVHLLGDPAFVPDVRVTVPLVERGEHALHLGRRVTCHGQPGTLHVMLVEVCRGIFYADLRQTGTSRLEGHKSHLSLKIGGVLGAAAGLHALPRRCHVVARWHLRAIHIVGLFLAIAYLAHVSVLPPNEAKESQRLGEMRRKVRLVISADRLTWWIRALRLIGGTGIPQINRITPINHDLFMRGRILVISGTS